MQGAILGTLDFMPPEQRRDAALVDHRSDLWSLAATFYQMVTGKSPKIIRFSDVPKSLHDVLGKALEDAKGDRFQDAQAFKDALLASRSQTSEIELEEGECPHCGTQNPISRKFCRREECGQSLEVSCLSCAAKIPMWEKVCGECGCNQPAAISAKNEEFHEILLEVEILISNCDFDEAQEKLNSLASLDDDRFQQVLDRMNELQALIKTEREQELKKASERLDEAKTHRKAFDYKSAINCIDLIPESMRSSEINKFRSQLAADEAELHKLSRQLKARIKPSDKLSDFLANLKRAEELGGRNLEFQKCLDDLMKSKRRDAERLLKKGNFEKAGELAEEISELHYCHPYVKKGWVNNFLKKLEKQKQSENDRLELKGLTQSIQGWAEEDDLFSNESGLGELIRKIERAEVLGGVNRACKKRLDDVIAARKKKAEHLLLVHDFDRAHRSAKDLKLVGDSRSPGITSWIDQFLKKIKQQQLVKEIESYSDKKSLKELLRKFDKACNLGASRTELQQHVAAFLNVQITSAENHLKNKEYGKARLVFDRLKGVTIPNINGSSDWAKGFLYKVEKAERTEAKRVEELYAEALRHTDSHQYSTALKIIHRIPNDSLNRSLVTGAKKPKNLKVELEEKVSHIDSLNKYIREQISKKNYNGLIAHVEKLLELQPNRKDAKQLKSKLAARLEQQKSIKQGAESEAERLINAAQFADALRQLDRFDSAIQASKTSELREAIFSSMLAQAQSLRAIADFEGAIHLLEEMAAINRQSVDNALLKTCKNLKQLRTEAMLRASEGLRKNKSDDLDNVLVDLDQYLGILQNSGINDIEISELRSKIQRKAKSVSHDPKWRWLRIAVRVVVYPTLIIFILWQMARYLLREFL